MDATQLLLAEELLLLALDEKGKDRTSYGVDHGLAGALLLDLLAGGHLEADRDGNLRHVDAGRPDPQVLADALAVIRATDKARGAKHWVGKLPGKLAPIKERVAQRLVDGGVLGAERTEILGLTLSRRFPEADSGPERALREHLTDVLLRRAEPNARTAQLIALMRSFDLVKELVPKDERKAAKHRAEAIAEGGYVGSAVASTMNDAEAAILAATMSTVFIASDGGSA